MCFAKCDEIPSLSVQDIEKTKRRRQTNGWTDHMKTVCPCPTNKVCGGYNECIISMLGGTLLNKNFYKSYVKIAAMRQKFKPIFIFPIISPWKF